MDAEYRRKPTILTVKAIRRGGRYAAGAVTCHDRADANSSGRKSTCPESSNKEENTMSDSEQKLRQALTRIAEAAQAAVDNGRYMDEDNGKPYGETARRPHTHLGGKNAHCSIKQLPGRLAEKAA